MAHRFGKHLWAVYWGTVLFLLTVLSLPLCAKTAPPSPVTSHRVSASKAYLPDRKSPARPGCRRALAPHWQAAYLHPSVTFVPLVPSGVWPLPTASSPCVWALLADPTGQPFRFSSAFRRFLFRCCVAANAP